MSFNYSLSPELYLSRDDPLFWRLPTPVECTPVRIIGIFLCLVAVFGTLLNAAIVLSFIQHKSLRTPSHVFMMFMATIGLIASSVHVPLSASSSVFCRWLYGRIGCHIEGFVAFFYGCSSCFLLCSVCLSRCYIIIRPFDAKNITFARCVMVSVVAVILSLIVTILPFFGWNEYTLESARTSCCTNLYDRRPLFISYNMFIFVTVYVIPLIILLISNAYIYIGLKRMHDNIVHGIKTELSNRRIEMERRILKSIVITVFGFIFTWTPYTIVFFISAFGEASNPSLPMARFACACFAKTACMWTPLLYMSGDVHFRFRLVDTHAMDKTITEIGADAETTQATSSHLRSEKHRVAAH